MLKKFQVDLNGQDVEILSDLLVADFVDVDISWCDDDTALITVDGKTDAEIESVLDIRGLTLKETCRTDIRHRVDELLNKEATHERLERVPLKDLKKTLVL